MSPRFWRLGLVGHPVAHSVSPQIHGAALAATGLLGEYRLYDVEDDGLAAILGRVRDGAIDGLNVTIPHKLAVAAACDRLAGDAAALGAVNTVVRCGDELVGMNTDVAGLRAAMVAAWPTGDWRGRPVAVIGAGGAARAAVLAAAGLKPSEIRVTNRTRQRAESLCATLGATVATPLHVAPDLATACADAALVLQATSVGMSTVPEDGPWVRLRDQLIPVFRTLAADACVMDLVYKPRRTPWVAAGEAVGRRASDGLTMLVHQAALAFEAWTDHTPPTGPMLDAAEAATR